MRVFLTILLLVPVAAAVVVYKNRSAVAESAEVANLFFLGGAASWLLWVTASILYLLWRTT